MMKSGDTLNLDTVDQYGNCSKYCSSIEMICDYTTRYPIDDLVSDDGRAKKMYRDI